jgi:hypothetical protein
MHKHPAATALAIALNITMLTPVVSASTHYCGPGTLLCACQFQCAIELWNTEKLWDRANRHSWPLTRACIDKCVAAKEAARR